MLKFDVLRARLKRQKLFLAEKDLIAQPIGSSVQVVGMDLLAFEVDENAWIHKIAPNIKHRAIDLFPRVVSTITRDSENDFTLSTPYLDLYVSHVAFVVEDDENKFIATGSGDGYTRYFAFEQAKLLPDFYFEVSADQLVFQKHQRLAREARWLKIVKTFLEQGTPEEKAFAQVCGTEDQVKLLLPPGERSYASTRRTFRQAVCYASSQPFSKSPEME